MRKPHGDAPRSISAAARVRDCSAPNGTSRRGAGSSASPARLSTSWQAPARLRRHDVVKHGDRCPRRRESAIARAPKCGGCSTTVARSQRRARRANRDVGRTFRPREGGLTESIGSAGAPAAALRDEHASRHGGAADFPDDIEASVRAGAIASRCVREMRSRALEGVEALRRPSSHDDATRHHTEMRKRTDGRGMGRPASRR